MKRIASLLRTLWRALFTTPHRAVLAAGKLRAATMAHLKPEYKIPEYVIYAQMPSFVVSYLSNPYLPLP